MRLAHQITLRVFVKEDEDFEAIQDALISLCPFDLETEKLRLHQTTAIGFEHKEIKILDIELLKARHCNRFLKNLFKQFSDEQKEIIKEKLDKRIADDLCLYFRFDKEKLLDDQIFFVDHGNCFHIKISIAAFPRTKQAAKNIILSLLSPSPPEAH